MYDKILHSELKFPRGISPEAPNLTEADRTTATPRHVFLLAGQGRNSEAPAP